MTGDPMQNKDPKAWEKLKPYSSGFYETEVKPSKKVEVFNANNNVIKESGNAKRLVKLEKFQIKHKIF